MNAHNVAHQGSEVFLSLRRQGDSDTATWMSPEDLTLGEMSQAQKDKRRVTPLLRGAESGQMRSAEGRMLVPGAGGEGEGVSVYWGQSFSAGR